MTRRPNYSNIKDACCSCGTLLPTPQDHTAAPKSGELRVWQPDPSGIAQWICAKCEKALLDQERLA